MENSKLYELLDIPHEVASRLEEYGRVRDIRIPDDVCRKLFLRTEWDEGVRQLQSLWDDDPDGIKILWEQLNIVSGYTYGEYCKRGIPEEVFAATMKFCTRFLREHYKTFGFYKYVCAWWFPRQMSLNEFRIEALEYEFIDGEEREVAVHIPSDADMDTQSIQNSLADFYEFREKYYSGWEDVQLTCDTWMLMPELQQFLGEDSHIAAFQRLFEIDSIDREAVWYMEWIFPGYGTVDENLPEKTSLQRELKKYLLAGKKFGIAKGHIKGSFN